MTIEIKILIVLIILLAITIIPVIIMYNKYKKAQNEIYILNKRNEEQIEKCLLEIYSYKKVCEKQREELKKLRMYKKWYEYKKNRKG